MNIWKSICIQTFKLTSFFKQWTPIFNIFFNCKAQLRHIVFFSMKISHFLGTTCFFLIFFWEKLKIKNIVPKTGPNSTVKTMVQLDVKKNKVTIWVDTGIIAYCEVIILKTVHFFLLGKMKLFFFSHTKVTANYISKTFVFGWKK